jgi:hypothetical protein
MRPESAKRFSGDIMLRSSMLRFSALDHAPDFGSARSEVVAI